MCHDHRTAGHAWAADLNLITRCGEVSPTLLKKIEPSTRFVKEYGFVDRNRWMCIVRPRFRQLDLSLFTRFCCTVWSQTCGRLNRPTNLAVHIKPILGPFETIVSFLYSSE